MKYRLRRVNKTLNTVTLTIGTATRYFNVIDIHIIDRAYIELFYRLIV